MTYSELFKQFPIVRNFAAIQLIAYFGAWFSNVAIYTLLIKLGASAWTISAVAAMHLLPGALLAPLAGSIVDRLNTKKLMLILMSIELAMTLSFLSIHSLDDVWLLLVLLFFRMGSASVFFTTQMSYLPKILNHQEALIKANELHSIIWSFTFTAGMALGGVVVNIFGVKISFFIDALFFLIAIIILFNTSFLTTSNSLHGSFINSIKEGIAYLKKNKHLFPFIFLHASVGLTSFDAIVTLLADYHYKYIIAVPLAIGLTNAVRAFALMIGPMFTKPFANKEKFHYLLYFQGFAIICWAYLQKDFYMGLVAMFFTGLTTTTIWSLSYAMLQEKIEQKYLGRVLAYNEMIFMLTNVLVTLFIGLMVSLVSLDIITTILGIGFLITAYYYKRYFI